MPRYRVHRIKEGPREQFRWAAHVGGLATVKPKDYEPGQEMDAATAYAAWKQLSDAGQPLRPGDLLEVINPDETSGELRIAKYIGFEPAQWFVPEPKSEAPPSGTYTALPESQTHIAPPHGTQQQ